jgi:hypothetical protein
MKEDECGKTENKGKRVDEEDGIFPFEKKEKITRERRARARSRRQTKESLHPAGARPAWRATARRWIRMNGG